MTTLLINFSQSFKRFRFLLEHKKIAQSKKRFSLRLRNVYALMYLWVVRTSQNIKDFMENFMNSLFHLLLFAVSDNHVQQYGEINQLGGVFVNVMCRHVES